MITDWHIRFGSFLPFTLFRSFSSAWLGAPHSFPSPPFPGFPSLPFLLLSPFFFFSLLIRFHSSSPSSPIFLYLSTSLASYQIVSFFPASPLLWFPRGTPFPSCPLYFPSVPCPAFISPSSRFSSVIFYLLSLRSLFSHPVPRSVASSTLTFLPYPRESLPLFLCYLYFTSGNIYLIPFYCIRLLCLSPPFMHHIFSFSRFLFHSWWFLPFLSFPPPQILHHRSEFSLFFLQNFFFFVSPSSLPSSSGNSPSYLHPFTPFFYLFSHTFKVLPLQSCDSLVKCR